MISKTNNNNKHSALSILNSTIYYLYLVLFFITPLIVSIKSSELFEMPKMVFVYFMTILITTTYLTKIIMKWKSKGDPAGRPSIFQPILITIPLILIFITQLISTIFSMHPYTSWFGYYSRAQGGMMSTICFILLTWTFIKSYQKNWTQNIIITSIFSISISALYGIAEHYGIDSAYWVQDVQGRIFSTLGQPNWLAAVLLIFLPFTMHYFIKPPKSILNYLIPSTLFGLTSSYFLTKSITGQTLPVSGGSFFTFIFFTIAILGPIFFHISKWYYQKQATKKRKKTVINHKSLSKNKQSFSPLSLTQISSITYFILFSLFITAILFTKSRSGILALFASFFIFWIGYIITKMKATKRFVAFQKPLILTATFFILIFTIGTEFTPNLSQIRKRQNVLSPTAHILSPTDQKLQALSHPDKIISESTDIRAIVWKGAVDINKAYPLFGTGTESFAYSYYKFRPEEHNKLSEWDFLYNKAHNEYLNYLANNGILGTSAIFLLIISTIYLSIKNNLKKYATTLISVSLLIAIFYLALPQISQTIVNKLLIYPPLLWPLSISLAIALTIFIIIKFLSKQKSTTISTTKQHPVTSYQLSDNTLSTPILASLTAIIITNFYGFSVVYVSLFFFFLPALLYTTQNNNQSEEESRNQKQQDNNISIWQYTLLSILAIISITLLSKTYSYYKGDQYYNIAKSYLKQGNILKATNSIDMAIKARPKEADYYQQRANILAQAAYTLQYQESTPSAQAAITQSSLNNIHSIELNPVHLNIYKNATRTFLTLAIIDPQYYQHAINTLKAAQKIAPTDPQITLNLAIINQQLGNAEQTEKYYKQTLELKPNYRQAWFYLGEFYIDQNRIQDAIDTYQFVLDNIDPTDQTSIDKIKFLNKN